MNMRSITVTIGLSCFRDQDNIDSNSSTRALGEMLQLAYYLDELTLKFIDDYREHRDRLLTPLIPLNTPKSSQLSS